MSTIGTYRPGSSALHRLPAGPKMALLLVAVIGVVLLRQPWQLGIAALLVAVLYGWARIPWRVAVAQVWPLRWTIVVIAAFQLWLADWRAAVVVCAGLMIAVAVAALVTLTTRVTEMLDLCVRLLGPLRRVGVDPDRVGLVLALTIRCVPLLVSVIDEVNQARRARGLGFSLVALVSPAIVRALRSADAIGDALIARGVDD
ncbi:energy-coupling factor transporter transmembrane component T family protein [Nakamurella lactea]|uniref:energy-coupling factor transporter transmembrane component T family protein n=1 Tax=Nakamurella lactea TaxID=459515 RepID=UPI0004066F00|nr:energy-coupling factor transporter transmembrane protein EcfT [Nakamurella lactea]